MAKFNVNFSESTFDLIPNGVYPAVIDFVELKDKKDGSGNQYLSWRFTLTDEKFAGRKVWCNIGLTEQSAWVINKTFKALGLAPEGGEGEIVLEVDDDSHMLVDPNVMGMDCFLLIEKNSYNGQENNRASVVNPPTDVERPGFRF